MARLFLVRHGQDTDNVAGVLNGHRDTELTELGREQARETAAKLRGLGIDIVCASPLRRARETAQIIADAIGAKIVTEDGLKERDFGVLTGTEISKIPAELPRLQTDRVNYFLEAEGAEDFPTLLTRAEAVLRDIRERCNGKAVVIVTHGDIGKMVRAAFHGWSWEQGLRTPYFANAEVLELTASKDIVT